MRYAFSFGVCLFLGMNEARVSAASALVPILSSSAGEQVENALFAMSRLETVHWRVVMLW